MIEVRSIQKSFGKLPVLRGVSFTLNDGELVGLVGPSGAGKSVLLKLLGNVLEPDAGSIEYRTPNGDGSTHRVGFLFQEGALFDSMTVLENVAFPLFSTETAHGEMSYSEVMERAHAMLCEVGLGAAYKKLPGQLSGGMRRRVGIARALVSHPDLVLLDDPTGGLDPVAARVTMNLILSLHAQYRPTVVLVSHDIRRLLPSVERVLALFEGKLQCDEPSGLLVERAPERVLHFLSTRYDFNESAHPSAQ